MGVEHKSNRQGTKVVSLVKLNQRFTKKMVELSNYFTETLVEALGKFGVCSLEKELFLWSVQLHCVNYSPCYLGCKSFNVRLQHQHSLHFNLFL